MRSKLLAFTLTMCLMLSLVGLAYAAPSGFVDIQGHWAQPQIEKWLDNGDVKGYQDGTFKPDQAVTRAEFATLLIKGLGIENSAAVTDFSDVKTTDWFYKEVAAASAAKYMNGVGDNQFRPNDPMTREMAVKLVANYLQLSEDAAAVNFSDAANISAWAKGYVNALVANKVITGYPDNTFKPAKTITRAETLVVLDRMMEVKPPVTGQGIKGTVDFSDQAVEGATVRQFAKDGYQILKETATANNGGFEFIVDAGEYDLTAAKGENLGYITDVKVTKDQFTKADITMVKGVKVTGKLTDKNGRALKDVDVVFTSEATFITRTDASGYFSIYLLPDRSYLIRTYIPGKVSEGIKLVKDGVAIGNVDKNLGTLAAAFAISSGGGGGGGGGGGQKEVDKSKLEAAIIAAQAKADAAVVGTEDGNYPQAAVDALEAAIATATAVKDDAKATQTAVNNAVKALNAAVAAFDAAKIVNPGTFTITPGTPVKGPFLGSSINLVSVPFTVSDSTVTAGMITVVLNDGTVLTFEEGSSFTFSGATTTALEDITSALITATKPGAAPVSKTVYFEGAQEPILTITPGTPSKNNFLGSSINLVSVPFTVSDVEVTAGMITVVLNDGTELTYEEGTGFTFSGATTTGLTGITSATISVTKPGCDPVNATVSIPSNY